ncbi:MAG: DUF898 family protein [Alphaproteobacteria bacterium]|nr:DUF898 family protein [Alphaproteobacteria bacterium]
MTALPQQKVELPKAAKPPMQLLAYAGEASSFYVLYLKILFLSILTLGFYRFWGKTNLRQYEWSNVKIFREPFLYLGTGMELFKSFVRFVLFVILPLAALSAAIKFLARDNEFVLFGASASAAIFFFAVVHAAKFMGLRYRIGRTSWRGIRFELRGSAKTYMKLKIKYAILNLLTLGLYKPFSDVAILKFGIEKTRFGTQPFRYAGTVRDLQKAYYMAWLLLLPTLGFSIFWYKAKYMRQIAARTTLGTLHFRFSMGGGEYLRFVVGNVLMILFSLGLAYPYIVHRRMIFYTTRLTIHGAINEDSIAQAGDMQGSEGAELSLGIDDFGF